MDGLELSLLRRRVEVLESIIERSGLLDAVAAGRFPIPWPGDPSPDDPGRGGRFGGVVGGIVPGKIGPQVDPSPIDVSRLSKVQLQAAIHNIAAERARLDALEGMIKEQLGQAPAG